MHVSQMERKMFYTCVLLLHFVTSNLISLSFSLSLSSSLSFPAAEADIKADSPQSPLHQGAKRLANMVQCVCMMERPTPQPKRLVVTTVIHQLILSLMNGVMHIDEYLNSELKPDNPRGLK